MSEKSQAVKDAAAKAVGDPVCIEEYVESLSGSSRRSRQNAASVLAQVAKLDPKTLASHASNFADALNRPEAQTRWECLDVLTELVGEDPAVGEEALDGAEAALFDEDNGFVRLAAARMLCRFGASSEARSRQVWPLLDEAIQCYHGDYEYQDMLIALIAFAGGALAPEVKEGLANRVRFDAEHGKGALQRRSQQIIEAL